MELDPRWIGLLAAIANVLVQLVKGLFSDGLKRWIPLLVIGVLGLAGLGLAAYYGRDLVAGALEGFFAGASSVGFYEIAKSLPGVQLAFNGNGWFKRSGQE